MSLSRFHATVQSVLQGPLRAVEVATLQANIGYRCNLACRHCHIGAGPARTEMMDRTTIDEIIRVLSTSSVATLDITGGAPELHPDFRGLATNAHKLGKRVIVRTNLAVLLEAGMTDLPEFYAQNHFEVVASLPCYLESNVDAVRGSGAHAKSIEAIKRLNDQGYGIQSDLALSLVYNPAGAFLPPDQGQLEQDYRRELAARYSISFTRLYTVTNMPLGRFRDELAQSGSLPGYQNALACAFNPVTLERIMCRRMVSVAPDGRLFDCDFNQVLGLAPDPQAPAHIRDFDQAILSRRAISVDDHCFGCTAGRGST